MRAEAHAEQVPDLPLLPLGAGVHERRRVDAGVILGQRDLHEQRVAGLEVAHGVEDLVGALPLRRGAEDVVAVAVGVAQRAQRFEQRRRGKLDPEVEGRRPEPRPEGVDDLRRRHGSPP